MEALALDGAAVLITGAGRGIGKATAAEFLARGAGVCIGDLDEGAAVSASKELGEGAHGFALDVRSRDSFARFVADAEEAVGRPDVLVNNAGIMPLGSFLDEDDETSRRTIDVNLWGPILGMKLVLPGMVDRGRGHVVNVASMMGKLHVPGAAVYGASKYAVVGLNSTVRDELDGTGVTVTAVLPGIVRTELISGISLPRLLPAVAPEQVAKAIVDSCRDRPAEVHVPRWFAAYEPATALVPRPVIGALRRVLGDDRALKTDPAERAAYEARVRGKGEEPAE
jgi:NAD(P)-dependent dehydrogenase (short-subunit alcohol dehydrogenase family)